ncbi:MAG TPA: type IV pilus twitching motility protein PilT [Thermoanaerobaculia bacterium]|jgi:twitching motility protein PilT
MASLETILKQAFAGGGREVRLITGRKILVLTAAGEREMQGPDVTPQLVQQLVAPAMPAEARQAIAAGRATWIIPVSEVGNVRAVAEVAGGVPRVSFTLDGVAPVNDAPIRVAVAPSYVESPHIESNGETAAMDALFRQMFEMKASDLHISTGAPPIVRHDGEIKPLPGGRPLSSAEIERLLMPIAPEKNREEFERRNDTDFAYELEGVSRFRCNFFRDRKGIGGVFRVIPSRIITAEEMGLSKEILDLCFLSKGLVLVTGPTGSGKSTTLCALIDYINRHRTDHIITIEDPIEFVHDNKKCLINQRQVGDHTGSFKDALRAALREDPDIVLVGEMRDLETIAIAIETAETGHLVFGTLHTSSAATTVDRIIDQFPAERQEQIRVMLASSLKGVISQMLCRKTGGGRVPALEVLIGTPSVANLIREAKIFQIPSIMQTSRKAGMCLMNDSLLDLVKRGIVAAEEAYAKAVDKAGLASMFKANNISLAVREA